jgi:hypothetical protein
MASDRLEHADGEVRMEVVVASLQALSPFRWCASGHGGRRFKSCLPHDGGVVAPDPSKMPAAVESRWFGGKWRRRGCGLLMPPPPRHVRALRRYPSPTLARAATVARPIKVGVVTTGVRSLSSSDGAAAWHRACSPPSWCRFPRSPSTTPRGPLSSCP